MRLLSIIILKEEKLEMKKMKIPEDKEVKKFNALNNENNEIIIN